VTEKRAADATRQNDTTDDQIAVLSREQALEIIPGLLIEGETGPATALSQLIWSTAGEPSDALTSALEQAVQANRYSDAIALFENWATQASVTGEAHRLVGISYAQQGAIHLARHHLLTALRLGSHRASIDLIDLELRELRPVAAKRWLEAAQRAPAHAVGHPGIVHHRRGRVHQALGEFNEARLQYRRAIDDLESGGGHEPLVNVLTDLAQLEFDLARFKQAYDLCLRAQRLTSSPALTWQLEAKAQLCLACLGLDVEDETVFKAPTVDDREILTTGLLDSAWVAQLNDKAERARQLVQQATTSSGDVPALRFAGVARATVLAAMLQLPGLDDAATELATLLEPGLAGPHLEAIAALTRVAAQLNTEEPLELVSALNRIIEGLDRQPLPLETPFAWALRAEALLACGRLEAARRDALRLVAWWKTHGHTPLLALWMDHGPRLNAWMRRSGDPALRLVHVRLPEAGAPAVLAVRLVTFTAQPRLMLDDRPLPLGNRHLLPLLAYLYAKGVDGASIAEIGLALYLELRGERLRNRVKNARIEFQNEINADLIAIVSEGGTRSMRLRLEHGKHVRLEWDLEEFTRALEAGGSDWVWMLGEYEGAFLEGYDEGHGEGWVESTRERFETHLLERAAHLISSWFADGRLEDVRALAAALSQRELLDPTSHLADAIAALDVRAAGILLGAEAAMAVWAAQHARFQSVYADSPMLDAIGSESFSTNEQ
jgi:tetratricopeptide (TPR) repeat protein